MDRLLMIDTKSESSRWFVQQADSLNQAVATVFESAVIVLGDRDKLKQVLINLLRNACKAIAPGETVTCTVELHTDAS